MPSYGERLGGGAVCPLCREMASSEAEMCCAVEGPEGSPRARWKLPRGLRGVWMGRTASVGRVLGFFESFPFFQIGRRLWAQLHNMCLCFLE